MPDPPDRIGVSEDDLEQPGAPPVCPMPQAPVSHVNKQIVIVLQNRVKVLPIPRRQITSVEIQPELEERRAHLTDARFGDQMRADPCG